MSSGEIPSKKSRDGIPTKMYVVQLARFEEMHDLPKTFPKGTFLWANPDHKNEKLLLSGFYGSYQEAMEAANLWKRHEQFANAFARYDPFLIRYD